MNIPNFIEVYSNIYSHDFCNKVIDFFEQSHQSGFTRTRQIIDGSNKIDREDNACFINEFSMSHIAKDLSNEFNDVFWHQGYKYYSDKYHILLNCGQTNVYTAKIQKTEPGQGYHVWHCEQGDRYVANRVLAWTVYLNDDFEAGETEFLYQQYRYKPSKGDLVIFPASFTHTHRGNPPIGGDKYIITGWVEF